MKSRAEIIFTRPIKVLKIYILNSNNNKITCLQPNKIDKIFKKSNNMKRYNNKTIIHHHILPLVTIILIKIIKTI